MPSFQCMECVDLVFKTQGLLLVQSHPLQYHWRRGKIHQDFESATLCGECVVLGKGNIVVIKMLLWFKRLLLSFHDQEQIFLMVII